MSNPRILLLGDCIATGQDLLWPEVLGDKNLVADPIKCSTNKEFRKKLILWFLKKNNKEKINLKDVHSLSWKLKMKKEKELSWPSHIPNCTNLAVSGESFQGMHKKLKTMLSGKSKIDRVFITDFSDTHRCVVINQNNKKYVVKRDMHFLELPQDIWPSSVYKEFVNKVRKQEVYGVEYQRRKNKKSYRMLISLLEQKNIPYQFLIFRKHNVYLTSQYVDLSDLTAKYTDQNTGKVICTEKLAAQRDIAERLGVL